MAATNPELQAKLQELEQELEEGEITTKGYQKRRTLILSQYFEPGQEPQLNLQPEKTRGALKVHNAADTIHPASQETSRRTSFMGMPPPSASQPSHHDLPHTYSNLEPPQPQALGGLRVVNDTSRNSSYGTMNPYQNPSDVSYDNSRNATMMSANYAFNPANEAGYSAEDPNGTISPEAQTRQSTMLDQGYFSDFTGQQTGDSRDSSYGGPALRYSQTNDFSPTAAIPPPLLKGNDLPASTLHQLPLDPRDTPFAIYDPHNTNIPMSKFDNIAAVLRHRARTNAKHTAFWVLDPRGKELASITFDKLGSRAEKVAQVIRDKSSLYRGDRVALVYRDTEIIDFAVALLGCFIAGVVAVPINEKSERKDFMKDFTRLNMILTTTQAHLALTTDANLKNFQRDITLHKIQWPRGVEWWKTNEFGSFHPKKKDEMPPVVVPDLGYIEFSTAPTGDIRGVVMSHRTIMHQMSCFSSIVQTIPNHTDTFNTRLHGPDGRMIGRGPLGETILSYLDPRQSIGMILGVLFTIYGGHTTIWIETKVFDSPGLYAHLITKYKTTLMVADYPGLRRTAYNYQADPMTTRNFKKNFEPNFSSVKLCMIDTLTVDPEFHEILADRWLRPMRNPRAREIVAPMLCLPEHGGMVISMRDWLGGEERMGCPLDTLHEDEDDEPELEAPANTSGYSSLIGGGGGARKAQPKRRTELSEVLLDKESLKTNEVVVVAVGEEAQKRSGEVNTVRIGAFGYPIPDATLAVVDPETSLLCTPNVIGEIWVDSPSLSGGFWALPKHTESIFHARPYKFTEGNPTPVAVEPEFLRTGLLGTVIDGKIFILGLYEDRLRQRVEWVEHGMELTEHRYFFVQHLIISILKNVSKVFDASAFDVFVNDEHLPVILIESPAASTAPLTSGGPPRPLDTALLDSLSERCMEVLYQEHHLRVYCVMITAPNTLPKVMKNGREDIGNMLCRREFDNGSLPCVHVKFGVERSVMNLPVGVDPVGGIWSPISTATRQDILHMQEKQFSGVDFREVVIDDRTSTPLNNFSSIVELFQWRVGRQAEELAYCTIDGRGREGKGVNWKKFDHKVAAVASFLQNKCKLKPGDHVVLMYTHSEEFVYAVHACFCLGIVAIPMAPLDQNRLNEDAPAFLHLTSDYKVKAVLVNADVNDLLKSKVVNQHMKQSAQILRVNIPATYNTAKPTKQTHGCRELGFTVKPAWVQPGYPVLIWTYWTPDQRRIAVQLGHDTIMGICKVQKETCQMRSSTPVLGCVRSTCGLGFVHACLMGLFVGAPTYLVSPVDFAANPATLFLTLSRYKIKDTYATAQMLAYAMNTIPGKGFTLHELKNMMIATEGRPPVDIFQKTRSHFAQAGLDTTAINTIYSHVLNPMIASRSYMSIEPVELWLDTRALRRGLIYPVDNDSSSTSLLIQDSGMVPVNTQIAIVNPETNRLCYNGEYGEIWVQSDACVRSFYGSKDQFDAERFGGRLTDGDPTVAYVRTGDLGFLHSVIRPIGPGNQPVEMQLLFVLGNIGETFEINGLSHFPMDIESSVEKCHRSIVPGGCAVFQAGGLVVILVEVGRKAYLASIVPVIINAILNEHQLVADIVAFVAKGDFPRSRLGEKQRGKILASWVTRKMRTMAQFGIRDPDGADSQITTVAEEHSVRAVSVAGQSNTLRDSMISNTTIPERGSSMPPGIVELPAYESSILESPPAIAELQGFEMENDLTPLAPSNDFTLPAPNPNGYFGQPPPTDEDPLKTPQVELPAFDYDFKPLPQQAQSYSQQPTSSFAHNISGRGSFDLGGGIGSTVDGGRVISGGYKPYRPENSSNGRTGGGGGLRVANPDDEEDWSMGALRHMGLGQ